MIDEPDFSLNEPEPTGDAAGAEAPAGGEASEPASAPAPPAAHDPAQPLVVIEYRTRFWPTLLPPLLLLALAAGAVYVRTQVADWPGVWALRPLKGLAAPAPMDPLPIDAPSETDPDADPRPIAPADPAVQTAANRAEEPPAAEPASIDAPTAEPDGPARAAEPESVDPADLQPKAEPRKAGPPPAIGFDPPGTARPQPGPDAGQGGELPADARIDARAHGGAGPRQGPREPTPAEVAREFNNDVQREAFRRQKERDRLMADLPVWEQQGVQEAHKRRQAMLDQALRQAAEQRGRFRTDLKRLLATQKNAAGPAIRQLCEQYGLDMMPEVEDASKRVRNGSRYHKYRRADKVNILRRLGVPEQCILDELAFEEANHYVSARGGPRTEDEAWVRAAKHLDAIPPPASAARPALPPPPRPLAAPPLRRGSSAVQPALGGGTARARTPEAH